MSLSEQLIELEAQFWRAAGDPEFYRDRFADDGVMAFHVGIMTKTRIMQSISGADRWESFTIDDPHVVAISDNVASITYSTVANRVGSQEKYLAAITSVYADRGDGWKLVLHQQTPLAPQ